MVNTDFSYRKHGVDPGVFLLLNSELLYFKANCLVDENRYFTLKDLKAAYTRGYGAPCLLYQCIHLFYRYRGRIGYISFLGIGWPVEGFASALEPVSVYSGGGSGSSLASLNWFFIRVLFFRKLFRILLM